jgi:hypothetical protein
MRDRGARAQLIALAVTSLALAGFFAFFYGGGVAIGALALLELLALLALALGVAWAGARKR